MALDKQKYINDEIDNDYIIKTKNSALAQAMIAIIFFFIHGEESVYRLLRH